MTVDAILRVIDPAVSTNVDLRDIKVITKLGWAVSIDLLTILLTAHRGTVEDTELVDGLVLDLKASHVAGGVTRVEKAKIGLIQFCISPPKTDVSKHVCLSVHVCMYVTNQPTDHCHCVQMENQVIVSDYSQMDRILREERQYILNICKKIKKAGCNVLLIQKSILRLRFHT